MSGLVREAWEIYRDEFVADKAEFRRIMPAVQNIFWAGAQSVLLSIREVGVEATLAELEAEYSTHTREDVPPN